MADRGSSHVSISIACGVHTLLWNQTHTSNLRGVSQTTHAAFSCEGLELNEGGMSWPHKLVYLLNRDQEALKPRSVGLDALSADSKDRLAQTVSGIHRQEDMIVMSSSDCHSSSVRASGGSHQQTSCSGTNLHAGFHSAVSLERLSEFWCYWCAAFFL